MGPGSTAGIFAQGEIDTDWEVLMNVYGTAYDSLDGVMLTRDPHKLDPATINEAKGRFLILKQLAKKHCPEKLEIIKRIEQITFENIRGNISDADAQNKIRSIIHQQKISNPLLDNIEFKINMAQGIAQGNMFNFNKKDSFINPIAQFVKQTQQKPKKAASSKRKEGSLIPSFPSPRKRERLPTVADFFKQQPKGQKQPENPVAAFFKQQPKEQKNPMAGFFFPQPKKRKTNKGGRK